MRRLFISLITLCVTTTLIACGGGGDAGQFQPVTATLALSVSGALPPGTLIGGIDITIPLPPGVSVKATADGANPGVLVIDAGSLTAIGGAAGTETAVMGAYTSSPNAATIKVIQAAGFGQGSLRP